MDRAARPAHFLTVSCGAAVTLTHCSVTSLTHRTRRCAVSTQQSASAIREGREGLEGLTAGAASLKAPDFSAAPFLLEGIRTTERDSLSQSIGKKSWSLGKPGDSWNNIQKPFNLKTIFGRRRCVHRAFLHSSAVCAIKRGVEHPRRLLARPRPPAILH